MTKIGTPGQGQRGKVHTPRNWDNFIFATTSVLTGSLLLSLEVIKKMLEDILGCADRCNIGLCSSVGPVREGMKFKHGIPPGVDAQVDGQTSNDVHNFVNNMQANQFIPVITKPTRFADHTNPSLLDHM